MEFIIKSTFIKELDSNVRGGSACLVQMGDKYYIISSIPKAPDHGGSETLAFEADKEGLVLSYTDLAGGKYKTREETIEELELDGEKPYESGVTDLLSAINVIINPPSEGYYND